MDFYILKTKRTKESVLVYPDFVVQSSNDLLVKGRSFYAVWDEARGLWSRNEMDVARLVDAELRAKAEEMDAEPLLMSSYESRSWANYKNYISSLEDSDVELDSTLTFADETPDRKKYASKRLPYALTDAPTPAWDEIIGTLYDPEEREKLEWAIGSIISGDSRKNQKFLVLYGDPGSGKGTFLNIVEKLFEGYYVPFDAKAMASSSNAFSLSAFKSNPLVAIQHDGDLSRIEDNTKLNQIVSHEILSINEKYKSEIYLRAIAFLMLGTNEPVKITGSKSGILRRLIDAHPSGRLIPSKRYHVLMNQIDFELGAIAKHCLGVYYDLGKNYYAGYKPTAMMYETDAFYNYIEFAYDTFYLEDGTTLSKAWQLYKEFCEDSLIRHRHPMPRFRSELMTYFDKFEESAIVDGKKVKSYFSGFKANRFIKEDTSVPLSLTLDETTSLLDEMLADMPAQYAKADGMPQKYWTDEERLVRGEMVKPKPSQVVDTKLADLDTTKVHYVKVPENHIVIDFDLKDENGNKSQSRNLEAASEWPPTYAEFSKGGGGVHLHYIYTGDVSQLKSEFKEGIEVKTLLGNSSLRRKLSRCNATPVATITSGLPLKEQPVHDVKAMSNEKSIRDLIHRNLRKEIHPGTKPSIEFIRKILDDAYESGMPYDVSDLHPDVYAFAMDSSNHPRHCMNVVKEMKFMSEDLELKTSATDDRIVFFDVEVFPNLFIVCWKFAGEADMVTMINPTPADCDRLLGMKLVGFNCRRYDNHILFARALGYTLEQLYDLSQRIVVQNDRSALFGAAYDVSYTDIYDFSSKKQGLKKFEIELGLHHHELGLPWDEPVPEEKWIEAAEYCASDVHATEAVFEARKADFVAREILAELSGLSVNHTTQQHTAKIIFGDDKKPQSKFIYTDLSEMFPGYEFDFGKSTYRGEEVGEGGYVYAEPGSYKNVVLLDVASMHPASIELLDLFGEYTERFVDLKNARVAIKRGDIEGAKGMLDGRLTPYLEDESLAEALAYALKIVINIVYGLTSASFPNAFRDPRNNDNIVAKRGALFMIDLKYYVQEELKLPVIHIKTDSIKVPDATPEEIQAIVDFGAKYGYEFEHEATYPEFVLFNDAVYIAKDEKDQWHATGAQFQHPVVFKTLLSGEEITFDDMCETRQVAKGSIYVQNGENRRFVGRIGRFVPLKPGAGGGTLLRVDGEREYAVTGTKGYEWLEADLVKKQGLEDQIDEVYFNNLVEKARAALEERGYSL